MALKYLRKKLATGELAFKTFPSSSCHEKLGITSIFGRWSCRLLAMITRKSLLCYFSTSMCLKVVFRVKFKFQLG
jgi:hypothetical protein